MRKRLAAAAAALIFLGVALGIRMLAGSPILDSSAPLAQYSGTALYASMIYAGVFVLFPVVTPAIAAGAAIAFCWLVELFQLTGVPAQLSERSLLARLALGVHFDPTDLLRYVIGVVPLLALHLWLKTPKPTSPPEPT